MAQKTLSEALKQQAIDAYFQHGTEQAAADALNLPVSTFKARLAHARKAGLVARGKSPDDPGILKSRIVKLEKDLKLASRESADAAAIKQVIGSLGERVSEYNAPEWTERAPVTGNSPGVPTLFISDLHWGEVVHPKQIGGVNEYNLRIANERMNYTIETAVHLLKILDPAMRYPGIVMPLGGDMISGNIHDELTATNELNSMPCVLDLYGALIGVITRVADVFGRVFLPCVTGNHGRDTRKIWSKDRHHTSFDWLLYQFLAKHFADDKRITFYVPDSSDALYRIFDTRYLLTHGDQFRGGDSIIGPLGPLTRGNQKKQARNQAVDMEYDLMICGHWHSYIHLERLIVNGSMKGYDEYAYQGNFGFEPPRQGLWVTHPRYGITYRMPVLCEKPRKATTSEWVSIK
jgi:hypothetical protein